MKIRVVHIVKNLTVGGLERTVIDLCNGLDRRRFEVHVISLSNDDLAMRPLLRDDVGFTAFPVRYRLTPDPRLLWRQYRLLRARLREIRPDVVHVTCYGTRLYMTARATRKAAPDAAFVKTEQLLHPQYASRALRHRLSVWLEKRTYKRYPSHLTAVGKAVAASNQRHFGALALTQRLIINSANGELFDRARYRFTKADFGYDEGDCLVVHVGRIAPVKNQSYLLAAWRILQDQLTGSPHRARLVLLGDGPDRAHIEHLTHELGLTDSVRLTGNVGNVAEWLSIADIATLPSLAEGMPLVLAEEMMMGLPVVGSDIAEIADVIEQDVTGFCVPLDAPERLAERLHELIVDRDKRKRMGAAAEAYARREFSHERMIGLYETLYEEIAQK